MAEIFADANPIAALKMNPSVTQATIQREIRKRGFFGWLIKIAFIAFNIVMGILLFAGLRGVSNMKVPSGAAEQAGHAIGAFL